MLQVLRRLDQSSIEFWKEHLPLGHFTYSAWRRVVSRDEPEQLPRRRKTANELILRSPQRISFECNTELLDSMKAAATPKAAPAKRP
jgi:hypothetical protein